MLLTTKPETVSIHGEAYEEVLNYLNSRLPSFTRTGSNAYRKSLNNIRALCKILGNPQEQFKSIHIAGTNGKGSTSHMLASILQTAGYKTGLHTSPHLTDFRERARINGDLISQDEVVRFFEIIKPHLEAEIRPSFFELTIALSFWHFAQHKVDIAVIEVGLGGRLDSTNIITPELSIITNIGLDHTDILGNTLEEIASEKAGIIKPDVPVVVGETHPQTESIFASIANAKRSQIRFADQIYHTNFKARNLHEQTFEVFKHGKLVYEDLKLDLLGKYQEKNATTVLAAVEQMQRMGYAIESEQVYEGLKNVQNRTGLRGRWFVLSESPLIVCDTAHNPDGIKHIIQQLNETAHERLHLVYGMVRDKLPDLVLTLLPKEAQYYFCNAQLPRALPVEELVAEATKHQLIGNAYPSVKEAFQAAKDNYQANDLILVIGSTFIVAEILA